MSTISSDSPPPEAYLSLLEGFQDQSDRYTTPDCLELRVLNSIALLCVSEAQGEAFAVGWERPTSTAGPAKLFISGSGAVPAKTREYLQDVCQQLVDISKLAPIPRKQSPPLPENVQVKAEALEEKVLHFCRSKISRRFNARHENWAEYIDEYRQTLTSVNRFRHYTAQFDQMIRSIDAVHAHIVQGGILEPRSMQAVMLQMDRLAFRAAIHQTDLAMSPKWNWSLERFIKKITDHDRNLKTLMRVVLSHRLQPLFVVSPDLIFVHPQSRSVLFSIQPIQDEFPSAFVGPDPLVPYDPVGKSRKRHDSQTHCELTLLAYYTTNQLSSVSKFIGVSKLSCFASRIGVKALNEVLSKRCPEFAEAFITAGQHSRICPGYVYPIFFPDPSTQGCIEVALTSLAREHLSKAVIKHAQKSDR